MDIRQLRYLIALVREEHFTRAAEVCHVTQSTLSGRIRALEEELGLAIVARGQRYHGLTPEGERVYRWALKIIEDVDALAADVAMLAAEPRGRMTLGIIPSALPISAALTGRVTARYPGVAFEIRSMTSRQVLQAVEEFQIDAGLTYLGNEPVPVGRTWPLYREHYRLFVRDDHPLAAREAVSWAEAAAHPLAALTPDMQNRRIIDAAFRQAGAAVEPMVESNSVVALCAQVLTGRVACVLPGSFRGILGAGVAAPRLVAPDVTHAVGLVALAPDPEPVLLAALREAAAELQPEVIDAADDLIGSGNLQVGADRTTLP
ncbi:MAG TPA: LysR family transcriptional regulator [Amaricoccus sp.]|nr:LysR family transcriptional regulator [Amaricoccus sp.]